jgi:hypothetical protein
MWLILTCTGLQQRVVRRLSLGTAVGDQHHAYHAAVRDAQRANCNFRHAAVACQKLQHWGVSR